MCFKRHPDGRWGLEPQRWADGRTDFWRPLGEAEKPWLLRGEDHGTRGSADSSFVAPTSTPPHPVPTPHDRNLRAFQTTMDQTNFASRSRIAGAKAWLGTDVTCTASHHGQ